MHGSLCACSWMGVKLFRWILKENIMRSEQLRVPMCFTCKHFYKHKEEYKDDPRSAFRCDAFPDGIPRDIYLGKVPHNKPVEGDNGIVYERKVN